MEREVLSERERRLVASQQSLDPAADQRGDATERFGRMLSARAMTMRARR
jgi:hypothetical protein